MLLVLDVGNTNTVLGVFERSAGDAGPQYERLLANWRVTTSKTQTVDEYGVLFATSSPWRILRSAKFMAS